LEEYDRIADLLSKEGRPIDTIVAIAELCANTLYEYTPKAIEAVKKNGVNEAVERVVEADTLLSGLGFESCGVAAAHAIGQSLTVMPEIHKNYTRLSP